MTIFFQRGFSLRDLQRGLFPTWILDHHAHAFALNTPDEGRGCWGGFGCDRPVRVWTRFDPDLWGRKEIVKTYLLVFFAWPLLLETKA